jgi:glycosyltransferase involved in cell wall biosynthesis
MRKLLVEYRGKVILTSHSPKIYHKELVEDSLNLNYSKLPTKWKKMIEKVDEKAFELTDILIFPCVEAMEPYSNSWNKFDEIVGKKKKVFITTSINMPKTKVEPKTIRKKYKIPENAIIISYVGRHNETKGYDKLLKFGKRMLTKYNNIYFLIAGKEEPLKGLEEKRWIEIGWTNDPHSLINSSDIFILPNKETYFDLILLEVLALNKPVLLSDTGGNKYFKKYNNLDLYYFEKDNVNEMVEKFEEFLKDRNDNKLYYSNSKLIEKDFLMENFVKNYMRFLEGEV